MTAALEAVSQPGTAMTDEQRAAFARDGFIVIPGVLDAEEVARYTAVIDAVYERQKAAGTLGLDGAMHVLNAVDTAPEVASLIDHPKVFGLVWSMLGWNVHIYHSHLDVHPRVSADRPFRFEWHQDGGRQNRELETDPRPQMSVKLAFWLSDVSQTGRGNFRVVPGSHLTNWIQGPPRRDMEWPDPEGAIEVTANAGDVVFFDRRIWHARSDNHSDYVRKAAFFGYTYRWIAAREELSQEIPGLTPVQKQLLGDLGPVDGDHRWGHYPTDTPLYVALRDAGELNPAHPPLRP